MARRVRVCSAVNRAHNFAAFPVNLCFSLLSIKYAETQVTFDLEAAPHGGREKEENEGAAARDICVTLCTKM